MNWNRLLIGAFGKDVSKNGTTTTLQLASKLWSLFSYIGLVCEHIGYEELIKVLSFYLKCDARIIGLREEKRARANMVVFPSNAGGLN